MYAYLAKHVAKLETKVGRTVAVEAIRSQSLWISGSSAMPLPLVQQWKALSGSPPLERYGMTETGMILGNPLEPHLRRPGSVGLPFPGMEVSIREDGELWCRGRQVRMSFFFVVPLSFFRPSIGLPTHQGRFLSPRPQLFSGYWNNPEATSKAFDQDGWFRTGDTADRAVDGYVTLLGRTSCDIIKHKGYKLSALQIESSLLLHDLVEEACVFGAPDEDAGEAIVAVVCGDHLDSVTDADLKVWCRGRLAAYQVPSIWFRLQRLPRNSLGKVNKIELRGTLLEKTL